MEITFNAAQLIKRTIMTTGATTLNQDQKEVPQPRGLFGSERSQRSHFFKAIVPFEEQAQKDWKEAQQKTDAKPEEIKKLLEKLQAKVITLELTDQTVATLRKYFIEFSVKSGGFYYDEDVTVEEVEKVFDIKEGEYKV